MKTKTIPTEKLAQTTGGYGPWAAAREAYYADRWAAREAWGYGGPPGPPPGYGYGYAYHSYRRWGW
jgi:hypothetical protein